MRACITGLTSPQAGRRAASNSLGDPGIRRHSLEEAYQHSIALIVEPKFDQLILIDCEAGCRGAAKLRHRFPDYPRCERFGNRASIYRIQHLFQHQTEAVIPLANRVELDNQIFTDASNLGYRVTPEIAKLEIDRASRPASLCGNP